MLDPHPPPRPRLGRRRDYSPERPWEPLSDTEWAVLAPFVFRAAEREAEAADALAATAAAEAAAAGVPTRRRPGRPVRDPRARLDAVFWMAAHTRPGRAAPPWHALPERFGKPPDTVSRQFRRWARQGLWTKLLEALADDERPGIAILRRLESWICRAYRRAWRLLGVPGMALARRLGSLSALRGPSWLLPDPDSSEYVFRRVNEELSRGLRAVAPGFLRAAARLTAAAGGRRYIPRSLAPP
jgi:transposase